MSFVYVIGPDKEGSPIKIGISGNCEKRLKELQTGHPEKLMIHHKVEVAKDHVRLLERMIHKTNSQSRLAGEWFNLSVEDAKAEVDFAVIRWGEDKNLKYYL